MNHANMNLRRFRPSEREDDNTRLLVGLGYVPILFFLPLIVRPDSKPGRHTANQGLSLLALTILLSIVKAIMDSFHQKCGVKNYDNGVEFWFELDGGEKCGNSGKDDQRLLPGAEQS